MQPAHNEVSRRSIPTVYDAEENPTKYRPHRSQGYNVAISEYFLRSMSPSRWVAGLREVSRNGFVNIG